MERSACVLEASITVEQGMGIRVLLPYETIVKATSGEPEAVNTVIQTYTGYIKYLSFFQRSINDDIQDYLKASLMEALPKFRFDR